MITTSEFCKREYKEKLYKLCFDAGSTCPNRDGKCGTGGCIFCSEGGSGDFAVYINEDLDRGIAEAKAKVSSKFKGERYIAYFQAFTNTYVPESVSDSPYDYLKKLFMPVIMRDDIAVLSIATRPDCIDDEVLKLLDELNKIKPVWVELGLQTVKKESCEFINRCYVNQVYDDAVKKLNALNIHTITHVILYLPNETKEDMMRTVKHVIKVKSKGIKLQLLYILKDTPLADIYEKDRTAFKIPTLEEYVETLKEIVSVLPEDMVVHRLTGDPPKKLLIEPKWAQDKKKVLNTINAALSDEPYYVYMLRCGDGSLYTGSTNNVDKRLKAHKSGAGCKYTRSHQPVELVYTEKLNNKSEALKREYAIKQLGKAQKEKLILKK